jgi:hypothetical protein
VINQTAYTFSQSYDNTLKIDYMLFKYRYLVTLMSLMYLPISNYFMQEVNIWLDWGMSDRNRAYKKLNLGKGKNYSRMQKSVFRFRSNCFSPVYKVNLGCLHPVACVISTETCSYECISNISSYDIKVT